MIPSTQVAEGAVVPAVIRRMLDRSNKAWGLTKTLTSVTEIVAILTLQLALHLWIGRAMHLNLDAFRFSSLGKAGLGTLAVTGVFGASRVLMLLAGH